MAGDGVTKAWSHFYYVLSEFQAHVDTFEFTHSSEDFIAMKNAAHRLERFLKYAVESLEQVS